MSLYGSSMAQKLGEGTFIFDKIYPNRYLLDTNKDVDGVLIGRYALVEYDRPLSVIKKDITLTEEDGTYKLPDGFEFKYDISEKLYDIIPYDNKNKKIFIPNVDIIKIQNLINNDETEKIALFINSDNTDAISSDEVLSILSNSNTDITLADLEEYKEHPCSFKLFICVQNSNKAIEYYYFYADVPQTTTILGNEKFKLYGSKSLTPYEFNKIVDNAYINKNTSDDIDLSTNELWDSTAWIKTVAENKLKYVKVADLNVLTPTFTVLTSSDTNSEPGPITTFQVNEQNEVILDNNNPRQPIFNVPQYKQNENAQFNVRYPNPLNINIVFDTTTENNNTDETEVSYSPNSKTYNVTLGKYATSINNINGFIQNGSWPQSGGTKPSYTVDNADDIPADAGSIWQIIKETYTAINAAEEAADRAERASQQDYSQDLSVDWLLEETEKTIENNKVTKIQFAVENKPDLITSSEIQDFWNSI